MFPEIKVRFNIDRAVKQLQAFNNMQDVSRIVNRHAENIVRILQGRTPVNKDKRSPTRGMLRSGWFQQVVVGKPNSHAIQLSVLNRDPRKKLFQWLLRGTRKHIIRARNGAALRFVGREGSIIYRSRVMHPGTKPYPGLAQEANREVSREINAMMRDISRQIATQMKNAK